MVKVTRLNLLQSLEKRVKTKIKPSADFREAMEAVIEKANKD